MRWKTLAEAKWFLLPLALATALLGRRRPFAALLPGGLLGFVLYFFRDPERAIPRGEGLILAPADGRVTDIEEMEEDEVTHQRMLRVGIFLSVLDVHVNRAPAAGRVVYSAEHHGTYHDARDPLASLHNAARTWAFDCGGTTLVVRQITGAIARRIVAWARVGDSVEAGERFGMIRFGSRTELYLPATARVLVTVGDTVRGGSTILARLATSR